MLMNGTIGFCQKADYLEIRKKGKLMQRIFTGRDVEFTLNNGDYYYAHLEGLKNDTLFLRQFVTQRVPTTIGTYYVDTIGSNYYKIFYGAIDRWGKKEKTNFNYAGSAASLLSGGILLTIANAVVYLVDRKNFSKNLTIAGVTLGTLGYVWLKSSKYSIVFGNKYKLFYIKMSK
jgi:hypothetical protein